MRHNDDAFTAMLLSLPLTADKEEIVLPLSSGEFFALRERVAASSLERVGDLIGLDVSGMMRILSLSEAEAYRLCMLLSRTMPLSYAMEHFYEKNIDLMTLYDAPYPERIASRLGVDAPAAMYVSGNLDLMRMPLIGIFGIAGVKMTKTVENSLRALVRGIVREGFGIVTSSELGACRLAESEAIACGGKVIAVLAGDLMRRKEETMYAEAIARGDMLMISLVHPDAPHTVVHAQARNRLVYALPVASFIATTDGKRGEYEALRKRYADWLYAFDTPEPAGNRVVIGRGAIPVYDIAQMDFSQYARNWRMASAEQLSFL